MWKQQFKIIAEKTFEKLSTQGIPFNKKNIEEFFNLSRNKWLAWEKGQRPSADDLQKIGEKLELSAEWLLFGEGEPEEKKQGSFNLNPKTVPKQIQIPSSLSKELKAIAEVLKSINTKEDDIQKALLKIIHSKI